MTKQSELETIRPDTYRLVQYLPPDDEISLVELWCLIRKNMGLILGFVVAAWIFAGIWLLLVSPVYKSSARLLPSQAYMFSEISLHDDARHYTPAEVLQSYIRNFQSVSIKQRFFNDKQLVTYFGDVTSSDLAVKKIFSERFLEPMSITSSDAESKPGSATASYQLDDATRSAQWLNQYIDFVEQVTREEMFDEIGKRLDAKKKLLRDEIELKKLVGKQRRQDQIARLEEALIVARQLGIKSTASSQTGNMATVEVNTHLTPLYRRGEEALKAELVVLKARKSDDPFILELRGLEEELGKLEIFNLDEKSNFRTIQVDQYAEIPQNAENKSFLLFVMLSTVIGAILGIVAVFMRRFFAKAREMESLQVTE